MTPVEEFINIVRLAVLWLLVFISPRHLPNILAHGLVRAHPSDGVLALILGINVGVLWERVVGVLQPVGVVGCDKSPANVIQVFGFLKGVPLRILWTLSHLLIPLLHEPFLLTLVPILVHQLRLHAKQISVPFRCSSARELAPLVRIMRTKTKFPLVHWLGLGIGLCQLNIRLGLVP